MLQASARSRVPRARFAKTALAIAFALAACGRNAFAAPVVPVAVAHATRLHPGDAVVGALPLGEPVHVEVALKLRDRDGLDAFIANAARHPLDGTPHAMSSEQVMERHAPTAAQAQAVANWLASTGYTHIRVAPNRLLVSADGTALSARKAFGATLARVRTHDGRMAFANTGEARVPAALADKVLAVVGLQNVHRPHTFARPMARTMAAFVHDPNEWQTIYSGETSANPAAVTVGILTEGNLTNARTDIQNWFLLEGYPGALVTQIVNTAPPGTDKTGTAQWDLDAENIVGMAGGQVKKLVFYDMPDLANTSLTANLNSAVSANAAKIVDVSFGYCETDAQADGSAAADDAILAVAVAQGQTFAVAAGDSGADECPADGLTAPVPSWPAASQYVVAVNGTTLNTNQSTLAWIGETAWSGTGGSSSTFEPMPPWQSAFSETISGTTYHVPGTTRAVADVAFDGDPASGAVILYGGALVEVGGSSIGASIFAGTWARVLQAHPTIGFAGPVIYALPRTDFHDIKTGNNGRPAGTSYDVVSGRGSMLVDNVVADSAGLGNHAPIANFSFTTSGLTANFTDSSTDDAGVVSHSWKFGDGATSTAANPSHTYAAAGTYSAIETVRDQVGAAASRTRAVTVAPIQLLGNPGFEAGVAAPWIIQPAAVLTNNGALAHSGSWYAAIGGGSGVHTDSASQTLTIPVGNTAATLSFQLAISTAETTTTVGHDRLYVRVYSSGTLLATLASYSNLDAAPGYALHTLDMTPYIGQKVKLVFIGVNGATLPTSWNLDDVALTAQ